jgi:nucleoside-diphosphate-sugar epimerase
VLVSGGCGFIGKNLVAELLKLGADVSVLDLPSADWRNLPKRVKHIEADILDKASLVGSCADIDIVYHLAARTDLDGKNIGDYRINFEGTKNLIAECRKSKNIKRLVFYSTQRALLMRASHIALKLFMANQK